MVAFDRESWDARWKRALREQPEAVAGRAPSAYVLEAAGALQPGQALDAGCGSGAEALWLAMRGWQVTAVDFSATALASARARAAALGADVAERVEWVEADLGGWAPPPGRYDLVLCVYVHVAGSVGEMVDRLGTAVAAGGTLLLVGHRPVDPATGLPTPAAGQSQVSVEAAIAALDPRAWEVVVAEERPRAAAGTGVDAVIQAVRRRDRST